ncbi:Antirepressor [Sphingopyxis granuli]|uniref:Antirepressor n=1 Tax=Sphingopyxis granuli TaxID=267128 RepID=A0AA86GL39_9SPHN|nr:Antirepressor [Sphingopyxis granuli]
MTKETTRHARGGEAVRDIYAEVTARIIAEMEEGRLPWVKPWGRTGMVNPGLPRNAISDRAYSGINVLILWGAVMEHGYPSQSWLTYRQAANAGGNVRKGERGTTVVYADRFTPEREKERARATGDEAKAIPFLKRFTVFNVAQCEGLRPGLAADPAPLPERQIVPVAEAVIAASGVEYRIGGNKAFYSPTHDFVQMPPQPAFFEQINYYGTALHELTHATGHKSRLARKFGTSFGNKDYAREELVVRRVGANKGVKICLLDSWENPCVPDLPVLVMNRLKSRKRNGTIACREKAQTAEAIVGRAGHRKVRTAKATLPELQSSGFYPRQRRSDGCNAAPRRDRFATESRSKKRVVLLDILDPACAACPPSVGSKGRTERLTASHLLVRVNTGSPKWARQRPTWRQSRHSSQMPGVMPRTAIFGWTATDESCRATGTGLLTGRVKGGSACETGQSTGWAC